MADLAARNVSAEYRTLVGQRCRDILTRAECRYLRDLSTSRIQATIAALAAPTKARPAGLGKQSLCHYVRALKEFPRWLHRERRTAEDPLVGLKSYNPETDKRHERRGFTAEEMAALLVTTRQGPERGGMTPLARATAYALAAASGLRVNEIRTLTRASFALDAEPPTVTVLAGYSKHRRRDVQPLPGGVAGMLADYLAGADPERPFPVPKHNAVRMLRADMAEARAAWIAEGRTEAERKTRTENPDFLLPRDGQRLCLDFHSFRHGYVTAICRATVSPRVMMELARHSDPRLTMKRYSRVAVSESAKALDTLPNLAGEPQVEMQVTMLAMTGTDGAAPGGCEARTRFAVPFAKSCGLGRISADLDERETDEHSAEPEDENARKPLENQGFSGDNGEGGKPTRLRCNRLTGRRLQLQLSPGIDVVNCHPSSQMATNSHEWSARLSHCANRRHVTEPPRCLLRVRRTVDEQP